LTSYVKQNEVRTEQSLDVSRVVDLVSYNNS